MPYYDGYHDTLMWAKMEDKMPPKKYDDNNYTITINGTSMAKKALILGGFTALGFIGVPVGIIALGTYGYGLYTLLSSMFGDINHSPIAPMFTFFGVVLTVACIIAGAVYAYEFDR